MSTMTTHPPTFAVSDVVRNRFWKNSLAASLAVALHAVVLALLVTGWSVEPPKPEQPMVLKTHLVMLHPAAQPEPSVAVAEPQPVEPLPAVVQPAPPVPIPEPAKPRVDPQVQAQKLEQAALARKRVEEKKLEHQAEKQQQLEVQKRNREAEEQRLAQQRQQQEQQTKNAELARQAAERSRQQAAQASVDSRQYLPLSKEAPDYPQRALDKNIEGDCTVEYTVTPEGKVENPKVLDGCHPMFMRPSLAAATTFRYQPRTVDGRAVSVPAVRNTFHYRIK
ncbi:energy transducer TonB [Pseudomonas folii]|uniref:Protein TonB n=1 Tax=Pseudomonas folii TaxID=2762593 RepID=A0ABR7B6N9_9PSED|nr:energy transducer TonB [Pseudomonas folii]MBC3952851.1 TonB family protein [Pseudomonas folii]